MNRISGWLTWLRATERRHWWAALLTYLALAICWSLATPLFASPDEPAHVIRAASVARGQLLGRSNDDLADAPNTPLLVEVPRIFASAGDVGCVAFKPQVTADCISFAGPTSIAEVQTSAGRHPPGYYAIVGLPSLLFPSGFGVRLMRLLSALLTATFFASALASARRVRAPGIAGLGIVVATTPMLLFLSGTVNPSAPEITAAMCVWVSGLVCCQPRTVIDRRLALRLGIAASALILIRPLGPLWLFLIGIIIIGVAGWTQAVELLRQRAVQAVLIVAGVLAALHVSWILVNGTLDAGSANTEGLSGPFTSVVRSVVGRGSAFFRESVGVFGWLDTNPPYVVWLMWALGLGGIAVIALVLARRPILFAMLTTMLLTWGLPIFFEARSARSAAFFWQGRYTLPLAVGIPILAGVGTAQRKHWPALDYRPLIWCTGIGLGAAQWLAFGQAIRRYAVGADGTLNLLRNTPWAPPIPAAVLLLAFPIGLCVWFGIVLGGPIPRAIGPDSEDSTGLSPEPAREGPDPEPDDADEPFTARRRLLKPGRAIS